MAFPTGWTKRCPITLYASKVGSGGVTSFTTLLTEANLPAGIWTDARTDGNDVRFSLNLDGTGELASDMILWDHANSKAVFRVGTLSLSSVLDNTLYVWYGNSAQATRPAATDTNGQYAAYDNNWKAYWPLGGTGERTSNQRTLLASGSPGTAAGKVGTASTFNGSTYYYRNESVLSNVQYPWTMMAWTNGASQTDRRIIGIGSSTITNPILAIESGVSDGTKASLFARNDGGSGIASNTTGTNISTTATAMNSAWHLLAGTMSATQTTISVDAGTPVTATSAPGGTNTMDRTAVGALLRASAGSQFTGSINEAQVHSAARSAAWITTEYNQTNAPGTFASAGAVTTISTGNRIRRLICTGAD